MKIIHKLGKNGKYYTALVSSDNNNKPIFDFDPFKCRLALAICDVNDIRALVDALNLEHPSYLFRALHDWEIDIL